MGCWKISGFTGGDMAKANQAVSMKEMAKEITMTIIITRVKEFKMRMKIAAWLIRLAGKIAWLNLEIKEA